MLTKTSDGQTEDLRQFIDQELMARSFGEYLRREYPERGLVVGKCQVGRVYHKPGKNCQVVYRLFGEDGEGQKFDQWFAGKISTTGKDRLRNHSKEPAFWPGCGYWKPVAYWPEKRMQLQAFPYDPHLPCLSQLMNPDFIKEHIQKNLSGFGLTSDCVAQEVVVHKVKYRPGKSCVLRYEAVVLDKAGNPKKLHFYSKTYKDAQSRYVYDILRQICSSPACKAGLLNIPKPVVHLDGANTFWQQAWEGINLNQAGRADGWTHLLEAGLLSKMAAMLAMFHHIPDLSEQLHHSPSWGTMLENAKEDIRHICQFHQEYEEALGTVLETLERVGRELTFNAPRTLIHGTFKMAQILAREDQLAMVDFDSIAYGDPLSDLAEFIASLVYWSVGDKKLSLATLRASDVFIREYQTNVSWQCDLNRIAWYVVIFLLGKIHASLKKLDSGNVKSLRRAFELMEEWLQIAQGTELQTGKRIRKR